MPEWLLWVEHFISVVGFPIAVAAFLLWREYRQGKKLIEALEGLKLAIEVMNARGK